MINITTVLLALLFHWVADFIFQSKCMAENKSSCVVALLTHTLIYSLVVTSLIALSFGILGGVSLVIKLSFKLSVFLTVTFVAHSVTDHLTSKPIREMIDSKKFGGGIPNFGVFTWIYLDQVLHYAQLLITWRLLFS